MRVLIATRRTQGERSDDFFYALEGELVRLPFDQCDCAGCGCRRSFFGLESASVTTTALIVNHPAYNARTYRRAVVAALARQGFVDQRRSEDVRWAEALADAQIAIARWFRSGTVLEVAGTTISPRTRVASS